MNCYTVQQLIEHIYCLQRSCKGYIFTGVYLSTGGCLLGGGVTGPGGCLFPGRGRCLVLVGMPGPGGTWSGGGLVSPTGRDGYCYGRYASYWNAFLYSNNIIVISLGNKFGGRECFLLVCVNLFTEGGGLYDVTSCLDAWSMFLPSKRVSVSGSMFLLGVSVSGPMLFLGVCFWCHASSGVSLTETLWTETFLDRDTPWTENPWTETPRQRPPHKERVVRILLECILVFNHFINVLDVRSKP